MKTNYQAEINVLGGMMNHREALYSGIGELTVEHFSTDETRQLYSLIVDVACEFDKAPASILLKKADNQKNKALIRTADNTFVDYDTFKVDLDEVKNTYLNRQLYFITEKAMQSIESGSKPQKTIQSITESIGGLYFDDKGENIIDPKEDAELGKKEFLERLKNPDQSYGIRFSFELKGRILGFPGLDEVFRGAQGGDLFLLAAKTGEGKTAFAVNLARLFSMYQKYRGYYENTEMKREELRSRILAPIANVTVNEIMHSQLEGEFSIREAKQKRIEKAFDLYQNSNLHLSRIPVLTANKAKALAQQVRHKYGSLDYLFVDYIGRMDLEHSSKMQEWQVMFKIIQQMKELAMELNIPVFVLSQRNEEGQLEGAKKIANECDGVLYFEPISQKDEDFLDSLHYDDKERKRINYKIIKRKIRRSSNTFPIFCEFDKDKQFINQV